VSFVVASSCTGRSDLLRTGSTVAVVVVVVVVVVLVVVVVG